MAVRNEMAAQAEAIAFLAGAEAHGGIAPEHVETHLSHLFLTDARLKLKKRRCRDRPTSGLVRIGFRMKNLSSRLHRSTRL